MAAACEVSRHDRGRVAVGGELDRSQGCECPVTVIDENRDCAGDVIGHGEVGAPIARKVSGNERIGVARYRYLQRTFKRTVAIAQEDVNFAEARVSHGEIGSAIAVEVGRDDRRGGATGRQWDSQGLLERTVAVARQDRDGLGGFVENGQAEVAIASEIAGCNGRRVGSDRVGGRYLETAVAFAEQHGDIAGSIIRRGQVEAAVAVEITRDNGNRSRPDGRGCCGLKRAVAVAHEHRDTVTIGVGDGQVDIAVTKVARHECIGFGPTARVELSENVPSPLPLRISTTLFPESVTARSTKPVPRFAATTAVGAAPAGSSMGASAWKFPPP